MHSSPKVDITDYDRSGYDYRRYWDNRQYDDMTERLILKNLLPRFGENLIDIGGGYGRLMNVYQNRFKRVTIFDYSAQSLSTAQSMIESKGYHHVTTQQGDIYQMPFKDEQFDTALIMRVLHHLERPSLALHEIARILEPGGTLILQFANKKHFKRFLQAKIKRNPDLINTKPVNLSDSGIFYQFHPQFVFEKLKENGFEVKHVLSGSNLRSPIINKIIPLPLLLFIDKLITPIFSRFLLGPSIFIVAQKQPR